MILGMLAYDWVAVFLLLVGLHFLCDYPWQHDFLANQKNPSFKPRYIPWYHANFAHAAIHGIPVGIITGSCLLALYEVAMHFTIDYVKSRGAINIHMDQLLHIACKVMWVVMAYLAYTHQIQLW